eukprot:CAMPEP_0175041694 /NCGR_PEP_ID=MMETSP0052_2-20121109/2083_1 /TAXON_ID=51329 ORGANISM="Polytomella parva, Strain SAG 63-3" /NCGR_SAMPLE_ID=MMETSP0052_2 /ASSEMBLY_ACC=CAM_ASM_000194 /LENGTH=197 /DNA_ID=CAMNT_0016304289 /DNA_START=30 /DNA_END=623 /DNA_ORIENTATION=+
MLQAVVKSRAASTVAQKFLGATPFAAQQLRFIGGDKVPEFWGKPSSYTEGTQFLGTPKNHLDLIQKRPLSPDVIEIDGKSTHYQFPIGAISSIANRATGVALSVGFAGAGYFSLTGSLPSILNYVAGSWVIGFPLKFLVVYSLSYHYLGGLRHFIWDHYKIGNNADKDSLLELNVVEASSKAILAAPAAIAFICALL